MKLFVAFLLFVASTAAKFAESEVDLWSKFKNDHNRIYQSWQEESLRFDIFKANVRMINEHNAKYEKGESTYFMGINKFTDKTADELTRIYLTNVQPPTRRDEVDLSHVTDVPDQKNWTSLGVVTVPKDQGSCGCCYAFASVAAIESANAITNYVLRNLSVQQVLDCSYKTYINEGCSGGIIEGSIHYAMDHGLVSEESYPYRFGQYYCLVKEDLAVVSVENYKNVAPDEDQLKAAVGTIGPVAACAVADDSWFHYAGGIIDGVCPDNKATNHVVLVAGYGTENGTDYWYLKNSWGADWGLNGYLKVRRNHNNAYCLATYTAYPILKSIH
ncbi:unnamed protein product [Phyllotreta striolata]|uniref:Uncharacterized protein n=1 Tax=Phyllotreta striolata TaxID=444603 RepID=A0A9N9XSY0_PHYSR|nr:unnamed protein product [Phyllotreta striolata]